MNIIVISLDVEDFQKWKNKNNLNGEWPEYFKEFKIGHTTYYCITKVNDLCSLSIDGIIETNLAKQNKEYKKIIKVVNDNINLKIKKMNNTLEADKENHPKFVELLHAFSEQLRSMNENSEIIYEKVNKIEHMGINSEDDSVKEANSIDIIDEFWNQINKMKKYNSILSLSRETLIRIVG